MAEIVKFTGGVPVRFKASVEASLIDPVVAAVGAAIEAIALEGISIASAVVIAYGNARTEVAFYSARNRIYRTEVLEVVAKASAWQIGTDQIDAIGLPEPIRQRAQRKLDQKMWD